MKKIFPFVLLIYLSGLYSCSSKKNTARERQAVLVDIIIAEKSDFPVSVEVNGDALSEERIELYPEVSGRLTFLDMPDGAAVKRGTVLARINDAELQSQLRQVNVQLDLAKKTEQRLAKLLEVGGVNQSEYDAALSQVNSLSASVDVLNAQIDKTIVRAAFDGKLGLRLVSPGAFVNQQTLLGTLQQTDRIKIDFSVPETYSGLLTVGGTVGIQTNGSEEVINAVITAIEPRINPETRNLKVRARLENGTVFPGAFVKVLLHKSNRLIVVPSNAIIPDAKSNQVILVKNNKGVFVNVETGIRNPDVVEILSGISEGDSVIVGGVLFVRPNSPVKVRRVRASVSNGARNENEPVK